MSARNRVLHVLHGPEVSRIRFRFPFAAGTVTISSVSFKRVAHAIQHGIILVQVVPPNALPSGFVAQYVEGTPNELQIQGTIGRAQEGVILHELTHAIFDLTNTGVTANEEEAAAYVVGALYFRMTGLPHSHWNGREYAAGGAVADALLKSYASGTHGVPNVDPAGWVALRRTVMRSPVYNDKPNRAGILGTFLQLKYPHDGH